MAKRSNVPEGTKTEDYFRRFLDDVYPAEPAIKVYRIQPNGKQICVYSLPVFDNPSKPGGIEFPHADDVLSEIRHNCGAGKYLLRTVYGNGRVGPSRVVHIG